MQAYCDGVNTYMATHVRPLEFFMVGYDPEPWLISDSIIVLQLMSTSLHLLVLH